MAWLMETIDGIARQLGRDVIFLRVSDSSERKSARSRLRKLTNWLNENGIGWKVVGDFDPEFVWIEGGPSCIYLDVTPRAGKMKLVRNMFKQTDGSAKETGFVLCRLKLAEAMKHSERDDSDF